MAMYGNNDNRRVTLFGYSFFNKESSIDKTMLRFSMWKTTLRISIYPIIETVGSGDSDDTIKWDMKNGISIYLVPAKARMLADILKKFISDPNKYNDYGVPAGQGLITVTTGETLGSADAGPCILIRKINSSTGQVDASYAFETRTKLYSAVVGFDEKSGSFNTDNESYKYLDLEMMITQLEEYCKAMSNATAFSVIDNSFSHMDKIASKLGVDLLSELNGNGGGYNRSYFQNNQPHQQIGQVQNPYNDENNSGYSFNQADSIQSLL